MNKPSDGIPLTVKRGIELLGLFLIGALIVLAHNIIMPLLMAFFITILLLPVYQFLRRKGMPEILAILVPVFLMILLFAAIIWFFIWQLNTLVKDFPQIRQNLTIHLSSFSNWINRITDFSTTEQVKFIKEQSESLLNTAGGLLGGAALSLSSVFVFAGLLPVYIYLFLFYKNVLLRFIYLWFPPDNHKQVQGALFESKQIIKRYLVGLLIQIAYITILAGGILLIVGIKHAFLIAVIFALLNLIPYIGALIGNVIAVLLTISSSQELWPVIVVLGTIAAVQFLDNNILMPRIVGSIVKINALMAIVGVFIGGSLAGISGMFLSLPVIAVLKIVFDRSGMFKHWGVLLGDDKSADSR